MEKLKTYGEFLFESEVNDISNGKKVVFFPGRFQPMHNGHIAALKRASAEFGVPVVALQIVSGNEDSPFPNELLNKMAKDVVKANSFIADFLVYPMGEKTVIPLMIQYLRKQGYEPIGIAAGADRMKDYLRQIDYIKSPRTDTKVEPSFSLKMVDAREGGGPSGTKVRNSLKDGDQKSFNEQMPNELHKYYSNLRKYMD